MAYFSGQGKILIAKIDAVTGKPGAYREIGNVPEFSIEMDSDQVDHFEAMSGARTKDAVLVRSKSLTFTGQLEDWTDQNIAWATNGRLKSITGGAKTGEVAPLDLVAGSVWALKGQKVTSVVITDSTGSPVTVDSADYTVNEDFGTITMVDVTGYTQPFKAAYTDGNTKAVTFLSDDSQKYALRFQGINTVNQQKVLIELYITQKSPTGTVPFIQEDFGQISLQGEALSDASKTVDGDFGLFGRMIYL